MKHDTPYRYGTRILLILAFAACPALADLSRDAGKAGVVGDEGDWTMENALQLEQDDEGKTWSLDVGIQHTPEFLPGVSFVLESTVQEWNEPKDESHVSGMGDTDLSVFYQLVPDDGAWPAVILGGKVTFGTAKSPELGTGKENYAVILIVGKEFGELDINLELEFETFGQPDPVLDEEGELEEEERLEDQFAYTLAMDYGLTENLSVYVELFGNTEEVKSERDAHAAGGGLEFDVELTDYLAVFVEAGVDTDKLIAAAVGMEWNW